MKIGVKFCGGCNPYIDRVDLFNRIKSMVPSEKCTFEFFDFKNCDHFIVINGCSLNCAEFKDKENVIIVSGFEIDGKKFSEKELAVEVINRLFKKAKISQN